MPTKPKPTPESAPEPEPQAPPEPPHVSKVHQELLDFATWLGTQEHRPGAIGKLARYVGKQDLSDVRSLAGLAQLVERDDTVSTHDFEHATEQAVAEWQKGTAAEESV